MKQYRLLTDAYIASDPDRKLLSFRHAATRIPIRYHLTLSASIQ